MLAWFTNRRQLRQTAHKLYGSIVAQAREPWFYRQLNVPDTLECRFEILVLHVYVVLDRLQSDEECEPLAQALVDGFFHDMDVIHRELGVADLKVPKKMHGTAGVFYERLDNYAKTYSGASDQTVAALLASCVFPDGGKPDDIDALGRYAAEIHESLKMQNHAALMQGDVTFPNLQDSAASVAEVG